MQNRDQLLNRKTTYIEYKPRFYKTLNCSIKFDYYILQYGMDWYLGTVSKIVNLKIEQ